MYLAFGILKHLVPLPWLVRWAWHERAVTRDRDAEQRAVTDVLRLRNWLGTDRDCLQSSLLLYRELSRLGANPTLELGFRRRADHLEGHAWVTVDDRTVLRESLDQSFAPAFRFGRGGAVLDRG